jgi:hypothetical protein
MSLNNYLEDNESDQQQPDTDQNYKQVNPAPDHEVTDSETMLLLNEDEDISKKYSKDLPPDLNFLAKATEKLKDIPNVSIRERAYNLFRNFQDFMIENLSQIEIMGKMPPLDLSILQDGSVLIEWIFKDFRLGISLEEDDNESGWYLVSKNSGGGDSSNFGYLHMINIKTLLTETLSLVLTRL